MAASYPTSIKSFPAKANGDYVLLTDVTDLELEVVAIETALKTGPTAMAAATFSSTVGVTGAITAAAASFSGAVTVSGISASQAVFTNGSKVLASNAITGTGNVVMSASPTLTGTIAGAALTLSTPLVVSSGGTGLGTLTNKSVLVGAGTGTVASVAPGSSGNVLTSDGTDWASSAAAAATSVAFPATQVASGDANTLDDYEEGTWTPVLGGTSESGQSYSGDTGGRYVKIGTLVLCGFFLTMTTEGTISGNGQLKGLPFASMGGPGNQQMFLANFLWQNFADTWVNVSGRIGNAGTSCYMQGATVAADNNVTAMAAGSWEDGTIMRGTIVYRAGA